VYNPKRQHLNIENDMVKSDNAATNWTPLIQTPDANGAKLGESNVMTSSLKYVMTSGEVTPNHKVFFKGHFGYLNSSDDLKESKICLLALNAS